MTSRRDQAAAVLLTVEAAADRLSTSPRFIRRLIAERRIEFVKVGRHVRISESALHDFIDAGRPTTADPSPFRPTSWLVSQPLVNSQSIVGEPPIGRG